MANHRGPVAPIFHPPRRRRPCFSTRYRRELGAARRRVQSSGSSITETRLGAIEQVTFGEGPPVLLVHGVVGGADRCSALVLFSMAVPPYGIPPTPVQRLVRAYCRSEFLFWAMFQLPSIRNRLLGEPSDIVNHASAADCQMLAPLTESFLPGTLRADGIINDMAVSNPDLNRGYRRSGPGAVSGARPVRAGWRG